MIWDDDDDDYDDTDDDDNAADHDAGNCHDDYHDESDQYGRYIQ
jgi:hypothetical protein